MDSVVFFLSPDIRGDDKKADIPTALSFINNKLRSVEWNPRDRPLSVPKTVLFITTSNTGGALKTSRFNDILNTIKEKATVLVVGIGDNVKRDELEAIASDSYNVFAINEMKKLYGIISKIKQSVSLSTGMRICFLLVNAFFYRLVV